MYIIRTPWYFKVVWALIKGWVDEKTRQRIKIPGEDYLDVLKNVIDMNNIPAWCGG